MIITNPNNIIKKIQFLKLVVIYIYEKNMNNNDTLTKK